MLRGRPLGEQMQLTLRFSITFYYKWSEKQPATIIMDLTFNQIFNIASQCSKTYIVGEAYSNNFGNAKPIIASQ
jgi:hypothetical protein